MASNGPALVEPASTADEAIEVNSSKDDSKQSETHNLCGYLAKINTVGLLKGAKRRWFVFDRETCTLNYYRSHKDTNEPPIGSIPIADCVFTCTAEGLLVNSFNVTQGTRTHGLQAVDQKSMLWWLQELQYERRSFNINHVQESPLKHGTRQDCDDLIDLTEPPDDGGLLAKEIEGRKVVEEPRTYRDSLSLIPVLPRVEHPPETVGINSANLDILKPGTSALSEIGNKMAQIGEGIVKLRPKPVRPAPPSPASVFYAKRHSQPGHEKLSLDNALEQRKIRQEYKSQSAVSGQGIINLIEKMQSSLKSGLSLSQPETTKRSCEMADTLSLLKEEIVLMKTTLDSKDEIIELLKRESNVLGKGENTAMADDVVHFAVEHQLRSEIAALKLASEHFRQEADDLKLLLDQEKEKNEMLERIITVKDNVVMKLTNELQELESKEEKRNSRSRSFLFGRDSPANEDEAFKKLQEEVEAYRMQNKFLNNEILELTHLRKVDQQKVDVLHEKNLNQEALRCQLHSKYFILLSELDKMRSDEVVHYDEDDGEPLLKQESATEPSIVQQLVQEAVRNSSRNDHLNALFSVHTLVPRSRRFDEQLFCEGHMHLHFPPAKLSKHDKYGFIQIIDDDDESTFLAAASRLQQSASNIFHSMEQRDVMLENRWQRFIAERGIQRNAEFKSLVRQGIPHNLRQKVWKSLVHIRTAEIRQLHNSDGKYYQKLCEAGVAPLHAKQIDLDLLRTLPSNRYFSKIDSSGIKRLKRVLGAYSLHNPSIGYCQGLNRIAAIALLYLSEEDAFWCLVAIVECVLPKEYYTSTLTASQADQRVFRDLLAEKMPLVHARLEKAGIDVSLITFNWFLCLFCDGVPPDTMLQIWDVFLNESSKVLFRYALAFFKHVEDDILELNDYMTLFNLLRKMVYKMHDANLLCYYDEQLGSLLSLQKALSQAAFQGMNPLSMKKVNRLRVFHVEKVRSELHQLDVARSQFASNRPNASLNSDMLSDDEGD